MGIEQLVRESHRFHFFMIRGGQSSLLPHEMGKRMDRAIMAWRNYWSASASTKLPGFIGPNPIPGFPAHSPYLPGRQPLPKVLSDRLMIRTQREIDSLIKRRLLPKSLGYIILAGAKSVLNDARDFHLPHLVVERALHELWRAALNDGEVDIYRPVKKAINRIFLAHQPVVRDKVAKAPDPLAMALLVALQGNSLGRAETDQLIANESQAGQVLDSLLKPPQYYVDDSSKVLGALRKPAKQITYILDNAGEAVWDILLIEQLIKAGHSVTVVAKAKPAINDVTTKEFAQLIKSIGQIGQAIKIIAGWENPGIDLLTTPPEVEAALNRAAIVFVKGEANFDGLPPDHNYSFETVYLAIFKTEGMNLSPSADVHKPAIGQALVLYKPAGIV